MKNSLIILCGLILLVGCATAITIPDNFYEVDPI
jgi:hypothetical protein